MTRAKFLLALVAVGCVPLVPGLHRFPDLSSSFLVVSTEALLARSVSDAAAPAPISARDLSRITAAAQEVADAIPTIFSADRAKLLPDLRSDSAARPILLTLQDEQSTALYSRNFGGRLTVGVDANVLRKALMAAATDTYNGSELANPLREPFDDRNLSEDSIRVRLVSFVKRIREAKGSLSDPLLGTYVTDLDSRYTGILLFVLAHEYGHYVRGHGAAYPDYPACTAYRERELAADRFAAFLLARNATRNGVAGTAFASEATGPLNYIGAPLFLTDAYRRVGYDAVSGVAGVCDYPSVGARQQNALAAIQSALETNLRAEQVTDEELLARRIRAIESKKPPQ